MGSAKNELNTLGRKIFLDRYALKDVKKETLQVGDIVITSYSIHYTKLYED